MNELAPALPIGYSKDLMVWGAAGLPWLDSDTLGRMLHVDSSDFRRRITRTYNRNKMHFSDRDTVLLKVATIYQWQGTSGVNMTPDVPPKAATQKRDMRFFSMPSGIIKLCMFSDSAARITVVEKLLTIYTAFITGKLPRIPQNPTLAQIAWLKPYTRGIGPAITSVCAEIGKCPNTVRSYIRKIRGGESIRLNKTPGKMAYVHKKHRDKYDEAIRLRSGGLKLREISKKTGVLITTISNWTKEKCNTTGGLLTYEQETEQ
ncbi:MAG: hypothetical protein KGZ88_09505 [Methylomicrobium sp.]|nr:hypothetical protein [Methylomicrobium sp.]